MTDGGRIDTRIFVVGCPRSGTTLVQSLLASHSTLTSFTESHFFWRHFSLLPLLREPILTRDPSLRLREFLSENAETAPAAAEWFSTHRSWVLRARPLLPLLTVPVARRLLQVLDELALRRGRSGWVEKTPRHLHYVPFLHRVSGLRPRTHVVHVIRDGIEAVASLREASRTWEVPYDLVACIRRWNEDVAFSLSRVASPNDHFVFYEELTARPEAALRQLLTQLGLDWEPGILERYASTSRSLMTASEPWKADAGRDIVRSGTSNRVLTTAERDLLSRSLRRSVYDQIVEQTRRHPRKTSEPY